MKFRTEIDITPWSEPIGYNSHIVCIGSCFAQNIARRLERSKFRVVESPTGILFNPASIALAMDMMANGGIDQSTLIDMGGRYVSYDFHSSLSGSNPAEATKIMEEALRIGREAIKASDLIIVTLGTAWTYTLKSTGRVVANCHKQPAILFERQLMPLRRIVETLESIVEHAPRRVLLTISPVRHIGEGMEDNSLSKALLRVAVDEVVRAHSDRVAYFPAYEIMMDDLRDYRFYNSDMVHPSELAVDYIADKFFEASISTEAKALKHRVDKIVQASEHRPFNPASEAYQHFVEQQLAAITTLKGVDLSKEKSYFEGALQINL